jgi:hypothetical protein
MKADFSLEKHNLFSPNFNDTHDSEEGVQPTPSVTPGFPDCKKSDEEENVGSFATSKTENIYGMTLDKYFGGNFKSISLNNDQTGFPNPGEGFSEEKGKMRGKKEFSGFEAPSKEAYMSLGESKKTRNLNGSGKFDSSDKIYEEEETNSYSAGEDFAIQEESEDENNNSNGSAQFGARSRKYSPKGEESATKKSYVYGEGRKSKKMAANNKTQEKRNNKFMDDEPKAKAKGSHSVQNRNPSMEHEARETSIKERIEKKYKNNKKHHGGSSYGPSLQGRGYANGLSMNPANQSSCGNVEASSTQNQSSFAGQTNSTGRNHRNQKNSLNKSTDDPYEDQKMSSRAWGKRDTSEEMRSGGTFYTTSNQRDGKNTTSRFQHVHQGYQQQGVPMYGSKYEGFDGKSSVYNQTNKSGSTFLPSSSKNTMQGFAGTSKHMGTSRMEFSTNVYDPNRQTFYEKQMEMMRKTNLNKFTAEKNRTDEMLRSENEKFINKYTAKFNLTEKESKALSLAEY